MLDDRDKSSVRLTPGQHLKAEISRLRLDQSGLADKLSVSRQVINYVVNDRKRISRSLARSLGHLMDLPEDYWLRSSYFDLSSQDQLFSVASDDVADQSYFGILTDFQIESAVSEGLIDIEPFSVDNLRQASIDLTVSEKVIELDGKEQVLNGVTPYILKPGEGVNLETQEKICLKDRFVARVGATTAIARQGIQTTLGLQVDPGFEGNLQFCLINFGKSEFEIHLGSVCLSLEISALQSQPKSKFTNPGGGRLVTKHLLTKRLATEQFMEALKPFLIERVRTSNTDGDFTSHIPELYTSSLSYASEELSKDSLLDELRSTLSAISTGAEVANADEFKKSIFNLMESIRIEAADVEQILDVYGAEPCSEGEQVFNLADGNRRVHIPVPRLGAKIALDKLLVPLGALDFLDCVDKKSSDVK